MRDRVAIHKLFDRVLDELDEGKNFVDLEIDSMSFSLRAQSGKFSAGKPYAINMDYNPDTSFTLDDADLLIKKLDGIADTTQEE